MKESTTFRLFLWGLFFFLTANAIVCQPRTFTVNTIFDAPDAILDGNCNDGLGNCTLRAAIEEANFNMNNHDIILFNIPGTGPHTIIPLNDFPILVDDAGVTIDGLSEPGSNPGLTPPATANLMIEVDGSVATPLPPATIVHGFHILSDSNIIQGLVINRFPGDGIRIEGKLTRTEQNLVYCNFIGTDITGTLDFGNGVNSTPSQWYAGVNIIIPPCGEPIIVQHNTVRGSLISGNGYEGVSITNCPPGDNSFNTVENCYIGTDINGNISIQNDNDGVTIAEEAHDNLIQNNVISGNGYSGVGINGLSVPPRFTYNNIVSNNIIGLNAAATSPLGNAYQGVSIGMYGPNSWGFAPNNSVMNNTIAFNNQNGVLVYEFMAPGTNGDGNQISQNAIYANNLLGIDLDNDGVTMNDNLDPDGGANQDCNFPVIGSATISGSATTITGTVDIPNPNTGLVEVFQVAPDPSNYGEGQIYLGNAVPDAAGNWTLTTNTPLTTNDQLTATATDGNNNTSEFSLNFSNIASPVRQVFGTNESLFSIYPNPTDGMVQLVIHQDLPGSSSIQVYNGAGKLVNSQKLDNLSRGYACDLDLNSLRVGIYWVQLINGESIYFEKLVIIKE